MIRFPITPILLLLFVLVGIYYKLFLFVGIPFPADLLVGSYLPWLDYYRIPVQNPLISDVFSQFFLWKYLSIDAFKNLQWPLWNPYSFTGTPLLATYHSASLYPLNILLFLPKYFGWALFVSSQTFIAALNMYLFLGLFCKNPFPKLIGSLIFALGSLMTTWLQIGTAGHAIAWLPLSFFLLEKYIKDSKIRHLIFLVAILSLIILAGHAQITTYSIILIICYSSILLSGKGTKYFISHSLPILISIAFSLSLTALQLLPSLDLLDKSIRPTEDYIQESNYGLLPLRETFKFFIADFFGNPVTRNYWGNLNYLETSGFVGTISLPLLIYAYIFLNKKDKRKLFFLTLFPLSLIFIFDNPIARLVYQSETPLLTSSYANRALFIVLFAVSVICALTTEEIMQKKENIYKLGKAIFWGWAAILGIVLGIMLTRQIIQTTLFNEQFIRNIDVSVRNSILPFLLITTLLAFFIFIKNVPLLYMGIFLLLAFDLGRYFLKFNPFAPQSLIFPKTPAIEYLQKNSGNFRVGREHAEVLPPNVWLAYNLQSLEGYDPLYLNQYGKFMHFLNGGDLRSGSSNRYAELSQKYHSPFIDSANVKYFIGILRNKDSSIGGNIINPKFLEAGYKVVFKDASSVILENPNVLKRTYFANSVKLQKINEIEETIMSDKSFDPRRTILLSDDISIGEVSGKGDIKILSYTPNKVVLRTETTKEELLVLADQFEEGWKAQVNGKDTKISRANLIFRAVKIPAGSHEVKFSYWPKSFDLGLKISLATLGLIIILSLFAMKKQKF